MTDLVSVVIPVYNTNERFKACFESVLKQKYQNIEVILVDDGSFDTSAEICDLIALSANIFPVFVIHKPNGGVSRARNLGIDFANGKYLVFIDSDDLVTSDYISDFMRAREEYPDVGHIWCGFEHCAEKRTKYVYSENENITFLSRDDYFSLSERVFTQSPCMRLYDLSVLKQNNIRMIEKLSLAEDIIFNLDYLDAISVESICFLNSPNYLYCDWSDNSLKNKYRNNLMDVYVLYLNVLKKYLYKWELIKRKGIVPYYNIVYYKYVEIMNNTFKKDNPISYIRKLQYNNSILYNKQFIEALSNMDIPISQKLKWAYQTKSYFFVRIYNMVTGLIIKVKL